MPFRLAGPFPAIHPDEDSLGWYVNITRGDSVEHKHLVKRRGDFGKLCGCDIRKGTYDLPRGAPGPVAARHLVFR